jgi:hypothetical protein
VTRVTGHAEELGVQVGDVFASIGGEDMRGKVQCEITAALRAGERPLAVQLLRPSDAPGASSGERKAGASTAKAEKSAAAAKAKADKTAATTEKSAAKAKAKEGSAVAVDIGQVEHPEAAAIAVAPSDDWKAKAKAKIENWRKGPVTKKVIHLTVFLTFVTT